MDKNHTVKLSQVLEVRVEKAMEMSGHSVWAEFCRVALTEKCTAIEARFLKPEKAE